MLNHPELVAADAFDNVFIYDAGNGYIRLIQNGRMSTLIQGACYEDVNTPPPKIPFQLKMSSMVCFKKWIKTYGEPSIMFVS